MGFDDKVCGLPLTSQLFNRPPHRGTKFITTRPMTLPPNRHAYAIDPICAYELNSRPKNCT